MWLYAFALSLCLYAICVCWFCCLQIQTTNKPLENSTGEFENWNRTGQVKVSAVCGSGLWWCVGKKKWAILRAIGTCSELGPVLRKARSTFKSTEAPVDINST